MSRSYLDIEECEKLSIKFLQKSNKKQAKVEYQLNKSS